ncbi:hypothetical protein N0V83_005907 [Neocucurbitaria cava]|uniref:Uncharacterized protein n=1 Tax=Neocucurbitaria cava TaxID=798079 RepID=A0A9W8Y5Z9_9PLEO|nr:hypothetical protein N0V83_005907 [Neocucurbitaria cava]
MNFSRPLSQQNLGEAQKSLSLSLQVPNNGQQANGKVDPNLTANKHQDQQTVNTSLSNNTRSTLQIPPSKTPAKKMRYYANALSEEDKQALAVGEKNHNHKEWTGKDLVNHHEARKSLVPSSGLSKPQKNKALAEIEQDRQQSRRSLFLPKIADKVRQYTKLPWIKVTSEDVDAKPIESESESTPTDTPPQHASRSMVDLRSSFASSSASSSASSPAAAGASPPQLSPPALLSPLVLSDHRGPQHHASHARASSSDAADYFSRHPQRTFSFTSISPPATSPRRARERSPLANEVPAFQHNPDVTFDKFLAPHKMGKGETYWNSGNAKVVKEKKSLRRLSKMPSMPILRKRKGAGEEGGESSAPTSPE